MTSVQVLKEALTETGLDKVIDHEGHFTVFVASTNQAFEEQPKSYSLLALHFSLLEGGVAYHIARWTHQESVIRNE